MTTADDSVMPVPGKPGQLRVRVDGYDVTLDCPGRQRPTACVEHCNGLVLVHFDLPAGRTGEYQVAVRQPFVDIGHTWSGSMDCWRGSELVSVAMNYSFDSAVNHALPVICNYGLNGENRGVVGMLDHVPTTKIIQRLDFDDPPLRMLLTGFTRCRGRGKFRETVVIDRSRRHFTAAISHWLDFCRRRRDIRTLPAPDWARDPVWCSWYSHIWALKQRDVEAQVPYLQRLGIRTVLVDASWFQSSDHGVGCGLEAGAYRVNRKFFPDLRKLSRRLHAGDMKIMLWYGPLLLGRHAANRRVMAPYCAWDGRERTGQLCPFCPESTAHARDVAERLMRDYELDGLKLDFMDAGFRTKCVDPAHDHGDGNYGAAMENFMRALRDGILSVKPDAAIEYRISYSNLATQAFANCHRGNDAPFDADYMRRENLFLRLFCAYPAAIWNDYAYWHPGECPANIERMLGQQVFSGGVPTFSLDFTARRASELRAVERWLKFYRRHRDALARARLQVHSADTTLSISSLQDSETGQAFILIAGQGFSGKIRLRPGIRRAWLFHTGAVRCGEIILQSGRAVAGIQAKGLRPVLARLA